MLAGSRRLASTRSSTTLPPSSAPSAALKSRSRCPCGPIPTAARRCCRCSRPSCPKAFSRSASLRASARSCASTTWHSSHCPGKTPSAGCVFAAAPAQRASTTSVKSLSEILADQGSRDLFEYLSDKYLIRSGIAGVQPKVMLTAETDIPSGTTTHKAPHKPGIAERATLRARQLIVKIGGEDYPGLAENEYHCLRIAAGLELPVPIFWLSADRKRLVLERFDYDRASGSYLGFEDMVSLQGVTNERKYEGSHEMVARAIANNASPALLQSSLEQYFASVVLSIVLQNGDAHLKNFGMLYTDPGLRRLPALTDLRHRLHDDLHPQGPACAGARQDSRLAGPRHALRVRSRALRSRSPGAGARSRAGGRDVICARQRRFRHLASYPRSGYAAGAGAALATKSRRNLATGSFRSTALTLSLGTYESTPRLALRWAIGRRPWPKAIRTEPIALQRSHSASTALCDITLRYRRDLVRRAARAALPRRSPSRRRPAVPRSTPAAV